MSDSRTPHVIHRFTVCVPGPADDPGVQDDLIAAMKTKFAEFGISHDGTTESFDYMDLAERVIYKHGQPEPVSSDGHLRWVGK